jgi:hypothetical protein
VPGVAVAADVGIFVNLPTTGLKSRIFAPSNEDNGMATLFFLATVGIDASRAESASISLLELYTPSTTACCSSPNAQKMPGMAPSACLSISLLAPRSVWEFSVRMLALNNSAPSLPNAGTRK